MWTVNALSSCSFCAGLLCSIIVPGVLSAGLQASSPQICLRCLFSQVTIAARCRLTQGLELLLNRTPHVISLLHQTILHTAQLQPANPAVKSGKNALDYARLASLVTAVATGLIQLGLRKQDRVAVYLPKRVETVAALFGAAAAGGVFVPVNPLLKPAQVSHIVNDCDARILVTSGDRVTALRDVLQDCPSLEHVVLIDSAPEGLSIPPGIRITEWESIIDATSRLSCHQVSDTDVAAILYTSGSTGKPKGVVLSHRNMVCGAQSVAQYLENRPTDRLLAVLPFSFDYGLSQLTTAFLVGASTVLLDYLLPRDVIKAVEREAITGLAGVPPLWIQLAGLRWPESAVASLRYMTNSGGRMPRATLDNLRDSLPETQVFLMYGLTEAFRSTFLPPGEVDQRPESIGKAIPDVEILVVRPDGTECDPGEPGELVHRGPLVALGYWNDAEMTAQRFRPVPSQLDGADESETEVWSGDTVVKDEAGYLYFVGRQDEMIKTSGYRVSPAEVEEVIYASGLVSESVALGIPHPVLGQAIVVVAKGVEAGDRPSEELLSECRNTLPNFMVPQDIVWREDIPRNPNGKMDRKMLAEEFKDLFSATDT